MCGSNYTSNITSIPSKSFSDLQKNNQIFQETNNFTKNGHPLNLLNPDLSSIYSEMPLPATPKAKE